MMMGGMELPLYVCVCRSRPLGENKMLCFHILSPSSSLLLWAAYVTLIVSATCSKKLVFSGILYRYGLLHVLLYRPLEGLNTSIELVFLSNILTLLGLALTVTHEDATLIYNPDD